MLQLSGEMPWVYALCSFLAGVSLWVYLSTIHFPCKAFLREARVIVLDYPVLVVSAFIFWLVVAIPTFQWAAEHSAFTLVLVFFMNAEYTSLLFGGVRWLVKLNGSTYEPNDR